jgi:hypothetical protein
MAKAMNIPIAALAALAVASAPGGAQAASPAVCGPGDRPEPALQGQVPKAVQGEESRKGFWCGMREVGSNDIGNRGGNYGHAWVGDCAYVTTALTRDMQLPSGLAVIDVSNPRHPEHVKTLTSPGSIHVAETLHARGTLLVAGSYDGNELDVYDASDCRNPRLLTTWKSPYNIHNVTLSWDTRTLYIGTALPTSDANQPHRHIVAIDMVNPADPKVLATLNMAELSPQGANPSILGVHHVDVSKDGTRIYAGLISGSVLLPVSKRLLAAEPEMAIIDVSEVQARRPEPEFRFVSQFDNSWHGPRWFKRAGRTYLVSGDEAITNTAPASYCSGPFPTLADITDEHGPAPLSAFELEINRVENCPESINDGLLYSTHYTDVDDQEDARLGLFPMYNAGLRVADLSDPANPKEVGYFNPAPDLDTKYGNTYGPQGDRIDLSGSNIRYHPQTGHIWFVSMTSGFHVVELAPTGRARDLGLPRETRRGRCSRRMRILLPRRLRSATIFAGGRRVKQLRGRDLRVPVIVRRRSGGETRVRIVARTRAGKRIVRSRTYSACVAQVPRRAASRRTLPPPPQLAPPAGSPGEPTPFAGVCWISATRSL